MTPHEKTATMPLVVKKAKKFVAMLIRGVIDWEVHCVRLRGEHREREDKRVS